MEFSHDNYMNKTFNELVNMIKVQDGLIEKLNNKLQKKRSVIADLKQQLEDKQVIDVLFEDDDDDTSSEDKNNFTDEQITHSMGFFNENYLWLPPELLHSDKRCMTGIRDIYDDLKEWSRDEGLSVQGHNRQILKRPQLIQILREEHKKRYNNFVKWDVSMIEGDSEDCVNGSRNLPYFHCMKREI
jgi:hypothetical protein